MTPRQQKIINEKVNESVGLEFPVDTDGAINEDEEFIKKNDGIAFSHGTIEVSDSASANLIEYKEEDVQPEEEMPFVMSQYEYGSPQRQMTKS